MARSFKDAIQQSRRKDPLQDVDDTVPGFLPDPSTYSQPTPGGARRARTFSQTIADATRGIDAGMAMPSGGVLNELGSQPGVGIAHPDWRGHYDRGQETATPRAALQLQTYPPSEIRPLTVEERIRLDMGDQTTRLAPDQLAKDNPYHLPAGPGGGEFTSAPGGAAPGGVEEAHAHGSQGELTLDHRVIGVGGDEWNQKTAARLEREYQTAKPKLEQLLKEGIDEKIETKIVQPQLTQWSDLDSYKQQDVEDDFVKENFDSEYQYQVDNWKENDAPGEVSEKMATSYSSNHNYDDDWLQEAIKDHLDTRDEEGWPKIPYTADQLHQAVIIDEGGNIDFDPHQLSHPQGFDESEPLPGIEREEPSHRLTPNMREDLQQAIGDAYKEERESRLDSIDPPNYLEDQAKESARDSWDNMDDDDKFKWAEKNNHIDPDEGSSKTKETWKQLELPKTFRPITASDSSTQIEDYRKTGGVAHYLSAERAYQLVQERVGGVGGDPDITRNDVTAVDRKVWNSWVDSSSSRTATEFQAAAAEELGGRFRPVEEGSHGLDNIDDIKKAANNDFESIGGWDGLKAYSRAKWETTQYLLDKADIPNLQLYRGLMLDDQTVRDLPVEDVETKPKDIGGGYTHSTTYQRLPTLSIVRNGAASTTASAEIANNWNGVSVSHDYPRRVILRAEVPRTAAISLPVYGNNIQKEQEVVVLGTAWKKWDAWKSNAPEFDKIAIAKRIAGVTQRGPELEIDLLAYEAGNKLPHWLSPAAQVKKFDPGEARDQHGEWTAGASFESATPKDFIAARSASTRAAFLSGHTAEELGDHKLFLAHGGKVGYALDPHGDLQNVFNNGGPKGAGRTALVDAIKHGATTLDCFDGHLPALYSQFGFQAVGRLPFNDEYAPTGWNYDRDGRPDVIFMAYKGGERDTIESRVGSFQAYRPGSAPLLDSYDHGKDAQRDAVMAAKSVAGGAGDRSGDPGALWRDSFHEHLARAQDRAGVHSELLSKFNPDQPRDSDGRWSGTGTGHEASDLFRDHHDPALTAEAIIARQPSDVQAKINSTREAIAKTVPTDALVKDGGHKNPDGTWDDERAAVHAQIVGHLFTPEAVRAATPAPGEKPVAIFLGGRGGSGKSWLSGPDGPVDARKAIYINSDDFKAQLPGYAGWNAAQFHEESTDILNQAENIAKEHKLNMIFDATMKTETSTAQRVAQLQGAGYDVKGYYMFTSPEVSAQRAINRFMGGGKNGRYLDPAITLGSVTNERTFDNLKPSFSDWAIYDNNTPAQSPRLVAKGGHK